MLRRISNKHGKTHPHGPKVCGGDGVVFAKIPTY
jgi:hypothetical protein